MSHAWKTTCRFAVLGLLLAGLAGCGTEKPTSPDMSDWAQAPVAETQVLTSPIDEEPAGDDTGMGTTEPAPESQERGQNKTKVEKTPRNGRSGWNMSP